MWWEHSLSIQRKQGEVISVCGAVVIKHKGSPKEIAHVILDSYSQERL